MLEIDYKIIRDEKDERKTYVPQDPAIRKMNGPIVCFQAPNGEGKSTLLNIISAAFYGHRADPTAHRISPTLQSKIKWLMERKDQVLSYGLSLTSPDGKVQLISRKGEGDNDVFVEEIVDGKRKSLPFQIFKEKYFLIYEIPENPVEKLKDITTEVLTKQGEYLLKLKDFRKYMSDIQNEIGKSRDEAKITSVDGDLKKLKQDLESLNETIASYDDKLIILTKYYNLRGCRDYSAKVVELNEKIRVLKLNGAAKIVKTKQKTTEADSKKIAVETEFNDIRKNLTQIKEMLSHINYDEVEKINSNLTSVLNLNLNQILETHTIDTEHISDVLNYLQQMILEHQDEDELKNAVTANSFYNDIIDILGEYESKNVSIPGITSSLSDLIQLLDEEIKKNDGYVKISKSLTKCQKLITLIQISLTKLKTNLDSLKIADTNFSSLNYTNEELSETNEMDQYSEQIKAKIKNRDMYKAALEESGIDKTDYEDTNNIQSALKKLEVDHPEYKIIFQQDEEEFRKIISELTVNVKKQKDERYSKKQSITRKEGLLVDLQSAEPHKYRRYSNVIDGLRNVADNLDADLIRFNKTIDKIKSDALLKSEEDIHYNDSISRYLAKRIPQFPYNGTFYEPTRIDLNNKIIYTTSGKEINTSDISTGQGMSMYIQSLLDSDVDNNRKRKYIVIFDEAHTMDRKSFQPIKNELIKMNNNNQLMFALFVKPNSDEIRVIDLV